MGSRAGQILTYMEGMSGLGIHVRRRWSLVEVELAFGSEGNEGL